jgi:uncharacterized protein YcnI
MYEEVRGMRTLLLQLVVLTMLLTIMTASVAYAHVVVSPEEVPAGSYEKLTVSVPTEREVPTTEVRLEVPEGFEVLGVQPEPGWDYDFEEEGDTITAITWSGGQIAPREFQEFRFQTRTPEEGGEFAWNAFQTYESGEVVEWTGAEGSEEEASLVRVAGGAEEGGEAGGGAAKQEESSSEASSDTGRAPVAAYSGLGLGALALILALVALLRGRKT